MSIQSFVWNMFAKPAPFTDGKGILTNDAFKFLLALYNRTGQGTGIVSIVSGSLVAQGIDIGTALPLVNDWNLVGFVALGSGVVISELQPGNDIEVQNSGANTLNVYPPPTGVEIDALGVGNPYPLPAGKLRVFQCWTTTQFISLGN